MNTFFFLPSCVTELFRVILMLCDVLIGKEELCFIVLIRVVSLPFYYFERGLKACDQYVWCIMGSMWFVWMLVRSLFCLVCISYQHFYLLLIYIPSSLLSSPPHPPALFRATSLNFPPIYNSLKRLHLHLAFPLSAAPGGVRGVSGGAALALASASKPLLSRDLKVLKLLREFVRVRVRVCACRSVRVCTYTRASLGSWVLSY